MCPGPLPLWLPSHLYLPPELPPSSCPSCQILPHFNRSEGRGNKECVRQNLIEGLDLTNLDDVDYDDSDEPRHEMVVEPRHAWSSATTTTHLCSAVCSTNDLICGKKMRQKNKQLFFSKISEAYPSSWPSTIYKSHIKVRNIKKIKQLHMQSFPKYNLLNSYLFNIFFLCVYLR